MKSQLFAWHKPPQPAGASGTFANRRCCTTSGELPEARQTGTSRQSRGHRLLDERMRFTMAMARPLYYASGSRFSLSAFIGVHRRLIFMRPADLNNIPRFVLAADEHR